MFKLQSRTLFKSHRFLNRQPKRPFSNSFQNGFESVLKYLPRRSLTLTLIGVNVSLFSAFQICRSMGMYEEVRFMNHFSLSQKNISYGRWYTMVTAQLLDNNLTDVCINSILLYYFGMEIERAFGSFGMLRLLMF